MAKGRTNRRSKSKSKTGSRSRSRSRSRRGGAQVLVGAPWAPAASNMHRDLTAPSAVGNHFKPSPNGVPSGGGQPPVPAMSGPGAGQFNKIWPPVGFKGGFRGRSKNRKGGGGGGLFQLAQTAWDSTTSSVENIVKGYNGTPQSPSPWPWVQPELSKPPNIPIAKPVNLNPFKLTAAQRAANV